MADTRFGERENELDWENLSGPVPMDLIDPEFPAHPSDGHPPENLPASASRALPREESEALAREAGAEPPVPPEAGRIPDSDATKIISDTPSADPRATIAGATLFGGTEALQNDFARIRAEMEAEAEAEKLRKQEAEKEEAAQRARLEQWMANARARLLKADADLAGPAGRVRLRKDSSPSLYRLAEMQKTMHIDGDATRPDGSGTLLRPPAPDPMATISVPADQFLGPEVPSAPPGRLAQAIPPAVQEPVAPAQPREPSAVTPIAQPSAPAAPAAPAAAAAPEARVERSLAFPSRAEDPPYESGPIPLVPAGADFRALSREEALTRKVAKLRMAAENGENTLVLAPPPGEDGEGRALNFAIAAVVLIAVLVLGLGLFAATQAGLFDGLENRMPFLKPKVAATLDPARAPASGPAAAPAPAVRSANAPVDPGPATAATAPGPAAVRPTPAQPADRPVTPANRNNAVTPRPVPARSSAATAASAPAVMAAAKAPAARTEPGRTARAVPASAPAPAKARKAAAHAAPAEEDDIPAYARPPAKTGNLGEIVLRNSIEAAKNIDKDNLIDLYNRYALGFPGLSGEVVIGLTVDPGGRILEGSIVSSTTGVEGFDQELLRKVLDWRLRSFPEARPKFITVPLLFPMQGH